MNTVEVLEAARKKIEKPRCWTKCQQACDRKGRLTGAFDEDAARWCGFGALWCVANSYHDTLSEELALSKACGGHFPNWNDAPERTHDEVLAVFDKAIAAEKAKLS